MLADQVADAVDGARRLRAAEQEQVLAVAGDAIERWAQARVGGQLGRAAALRHPRPEDLLADVLDLDRTGLVRQVGERRLGRDQAVEQVQLVVLEADVEHVGLAAGRDVARHLERHRRLAGALRPADEQQLPGAQAAADRLVERGEAERHRLVLPHPARRSPSRSGRPAPRAPTGAPCSRSGRQDARPPSASAPDSVVTRARPPDSDSRGPHPSTGPARRSTRPVSRDTAEGTGRRRDADGHRATGVRGPPTGAGPPARPRAGR